MAKSWVEALDKRFYPNHQFNWDDKLFRQKILNVLRPTDVVLDLGAGAGIVTQMNFRGLGSSVCGIDPDPRVAENPFLDVAKVGLGDAIPFADETFDIVFADNVAEHLAEPAAVLREVRRVLKKGGIFLFKTPNVFHYMPTIARVTPTWFHKFYNRLRGRNSEDTFPTRYRMNSNGAVRRLAAQTKFDVDYIQRIEGRPEYLRLATPFYLAGIAYERLVNVHPVLACFRILLVAQLRKRHEP